MSVLDELVEAGICDKTLVDRNVLTTVISQALRTKLTSFDTSWGPWMEVHEQDRILPLIDALVNALTGKTL